MDEVELRVGERKLLGVGDREREPVVVRPGLRQLDVDRDDLADALAEESRDAAVAAADVERRSSPRKR